MSVPEMTTVKTGHRQLYHFPSTPSMPRHKQTGLAWKSHSHEGSTIALNSSRNKPINFTQNSYWLKLQTGHLNWEFKNNVCTQYPCLMTEGDRERLLIYWYHRVQPKAMTKVHLCSCQPLPDRQVGTEGSAGWGPSKRLSHKIHWGVNKPG